MQADDSTFGRFDAGGYAITIDDVANIAKEAGDAIMEIYNGPDFEEKIKDPKSDGSPLTAADLKANEIICTGLRKLYPNIPIMSEEEKMPPWEERKNWSYFFCVDPLDGTKEFIKRNGQFTVNIGLVKDGTPIAGVVYCPALDPPVMYKGYTGAPPAVKEECDAIGGNAGYDSFKAIFPKTFDEADKGLTVVASASHNTPETEAFIKKYDSPKLKSMGSSLKILMVADGTAHVYPRLAPTMEWDTCAAHAILLCGEGASMTQHSDGGKEWNAPCSPGKEVMYNKEDTKNPFFVAKGKVVKKSTVVKKKKKVGLGGGKVKEETSAMNPGLVAVGVLVAVFAILMALGVFKK